MQTQTRFTRYLTLLLAVLLLGGCGASAAQQPTAVGADTLTPVVAASELAVGPNRLPLGVIKNGAPLNDPELKLHLRLFALDSGDTMTPRSEADAVYRGQGLPVGLYVANVVLDQPGNWNMEVRIDLSDGTSRVSRVRLQVQEQASTPAVGSPAFPSKNATLKDLPDLKQLTSDIGPDPDLYQLNIAEALAAQRPFLVAFSTPGYCQTAVCGPNLEVIKKLKNDLKDKMNFVHVEVYPFPFSDSFQQGKRVPAMDEWKLQTEPWTFLVDGKGIIQAKYEGGITFSELEPALKQLLGE